MAVISPTAIHATEMEASFLGGILPVTLPINISMRMVIAGVANFPKPADVVSGTIYGYNEEFLGSQLLEGTESWG